MQPESFEVLAFREGYREAYWEGRDPILEDRLQWRAQTFRHLVHLLPGQTILELGCGSGRFTRRLAQVSRGENPIVGACFDPAVEPRADLPSSVTFERLTSFPGPLSGRQFDCIVALDLFDRRTGTDLLRGLRELLAPGGQVVCYESNPGNPVLGIRRLASRLVRKRDRRELLDRTCLSRMMSEQGFAETLAVYNDFVYAPLTPRLVWVLRNLSLLLENALGLRALAGSILLYARKPSPDDSSLEVSLCEHEQLHGAVSLVVPCHNERENVRNLVNRFRALYGEYIHEIVLVDDNSVDGTDGEIRELAAEDSRIKPVFRSPPNGVGRALRDGYRASTGRYVLSMDCDFQHLLPEVRDVFDAAAAGYDVVVGSRFSRHSVLLNYPFLKAFSNRGFHLLARIILRRPFRDLTNNLKLLHRDVVDRLLITQPGFAANAETGFQPLVMGYPVREVPISWVNRAPDMGTSTFRLFQVGGGYWRVLFDLCRLSFFKSGPYRNLPRATGENARPVRGARPGSRDDGEES